MKTTELMIGDYVLVKPSMMLIKVAAVHHKKVGYHAVTHKLNWVRMDLLEPIPLTPEFLERYNFNKFLGLGVFFSQYIRDHEVSIMVDVLFCKDSHIVVDIEKQSFIEGTRNSLHNCDIQSLHEFQHALRQCGLDEWADNFNMDE